MATLPAPAGPDRLDPELESFLHARPWMNRSILPAHVQSFRRTVGEQMRLSDERISRGGAIVLRETMIPSFDGAAIKLLLLHPSVDTPRPGVCFLHGGGMFSGDERTGLGAVLDWVETLGVGVVSVDYRLAPENRHPTPVEDCYAALLWIAQHRDAAGVDSGALLLAGTSAGGGLAAAVALLARDRGGPLVSDQILMCPMLDDRSPSTPSGSAAPSVWDERSNDTGWRALLGESKGGADVSMYAAPSRARNLTGLPAAFLDVGGAELFRDETIDYATRLSQAGVSTELHVWSGAFHGFDQVVPDSAVARAASAARLAYLRRRLAQRAAP